MSKTLIQGDCIQWLKSESRPQANVIIADPPDNLGLSYADGGDSMPDADYYAFLRSLMLESVMEADHFWLSYYWAHDLEVSSYAKTLIAAHPEIAWKKYIWRYTFGQHRESDCGSGFRYLLRLSRAPVVTSGIRVPSDRQTLYNDARANPNGRVPDDVWDFPRVTGNNHERRDWHPTQHPQGVYQRIIRMSPGYHVVDLFGGTGTLFRCAREIKEPHAYTIVERSGTYCRAISAEHAVPITSL